MLLENTARGAVTFLVATVVTGLGLWLFLDSVGVGLAGFWSYVWAAIGANIVLEMAASVVKNSD